MSAAIVVRYVVPGGGPGGIHPEDVPLTARELRDWQGRVVVGRYIVRPVDGRQTGSGRDAWNLFVKTVVGTREALETDAFVDEFPTFREAFTTAKRLARDEARKAVRA